MKINWFYRCVLYFVISMIVNPYYDGWSSTAKYLISEGVFSKVCHKSMECSNLFYLKPVCDEQAYEVGKLLSYYRISEFLSSIFTGIFMDNCGPKFTVLISMILRIISWILIPLYPNKTGLVILSCILCGTTSNGISFPVFTIAQYSKKYYNVSMIAISVSLCFGTFYTFILNHIKFRLQTFTPINIILVMLAITHLPLLVISSFIFPNSLEKDVKLNLIEEVPGKKNDDSTSNSSTSLPRSLSIEQKWNFKEFLSILARIDILVILLASMVNVISLTYSQESFPISYGNNNTAILVNEILIPLSFVFSIASVFLLNKFGSVPIIVFMNISGSLLHFTMVFNNTTLSVFTSILMSVGYSLFMTQYFLYLDKQVPLTYQGSIKGFLVTSIGFVLFINIGLNYLSKIYNYTNAVHLTIMVIRMVITVPLMKFLKNTRIRSRSFDHSV